MGPGRGGGPPIYRVVVVAGQSNLIGRTIISSVDTAEMSGLSGIKQFPDISSDVATYRTIRDSALPLYFPENLIASNYCSPANRAAQVIQASLPAGERVLIVPVAYGGTALVVGSAEWAYPGGSLNSAAVAQVNAAMAAVQAINPLSSLHSILWAQGEADASDASPPNQATYQAALEALITGWRADMTGNSTSVPFIIGALCPEFVTANAGAADVVAAQVAIAGGTLPNVAYISAPSGYSVSNLHYIHDGSRGLGVAMGRAAIGAAAGIIFQTAFSGADGALTTFDWRNFGGANTGTVGSNEAYIGSAGGYISPCAVFGTADYAVGATFKFLTRTSQTLQLRGRSTGYTLATGYHLRFASNAWTINRYDSASASGAGSATLGTYADNPGVGETRTVYLDMRGSTLRAVIDGVERISVTDATYQTQMGLDGIVGGGSTSTTGIHLTDYRTTTAAV